MKTSALAALGIFAATASANACELKSINVVGGAVSVRYDPFNQTFTPSPITLRVHAKGCSSEQLQVAATADPLNPLVMGALQMKAGPDTLSVALTDRSGGNVIGPTELAAFNRPATTAIFNAAGDDVTADPIYVTIDPGQVISPGRYLGRIRLLARAIDSKGHAGDAISAPLDVIVDVDASVRLAVGTDTLVDLGELDPGATSEAVHFSAYANVGYQLKLRSDHDWKLTEGGRSAAGGVPYEVLLDGKALDRAADPGAIVGYNAPHGDGRRGHDLRARVLPYPGGPAGDYVDYVTVEIRPKVS